MGYLEILDNNEIKLPDCCKSCMQLAYYYPYEFNNRVAYYCIAGLFLPTVKQTCNRRIGLYLTY